ncbi:hypothetical protein BDW02DRAFT_564010 [Decorospora gaudefroyi]|uniref:UbiA prenyltransferase n=1 Tax=Decorospora gaudefroyi TaxID=184978 RepID=A0A6A5KVP0_9PLEO|nr:hypothetical protein BDW02DRAFT_564010 [Decorospora gaudefroyi]
MRYPKRDPNTTTPPQPTINYHLQTLYLFTASDLPTFLLPTTLFGLSAALSGPLLTHTTATTSTSLFQTLLRIPPTLILLWTNLLLFTISNQRSTAAIAEDSANKPYRPLPAGRLTQAQATHLLLVLTPLVLGIGYAAGIVTETLLLMVVGWMYNDLGGCEAHFLLRNGLSTVGYGIFLAVAMRGMVCGVLKEDGIRWLVLVTLVMFFSQHVCDFKDALGDRVRGRRSAPIVLGDGVARWSVAVPVLGASVVCPAFFGLGWASFAGTMAVGGVVAGRVLMYRDVESDEVTWKLWALWTCVLFSLPVVKNPEVLCGAWDVVRAAVCPGGAWPGGFKGVAASGVAMIVEGKRMFASPSGVDNGTLSVIGS